MSLKKINPIKTESWTKLKTHFNKIENKEIKNYFHPELIPQVLI